jgi:hypothetical protein
MSTYKLLGITLLCVLPIHPAQQKERHIIPLQYVCNFVAPLKPKIAGYIKHESFFDSRQVDAFADGEYLLWPLDKKPDACGNDINAQSQFDMIPIETQLRVELCGPKIGTAQSTMVIEGDFFGPTDPLSLLTIVNIVQMRLGFFTLDWEHTSLLVGQYWHPLIVPSCYPGTISNNSGSPFEPYEKCPQLRVTHHSRHVSYIAAALMQLDSPSFGPIGLSTTYERNAIVPNIHIQAYAHAADHLFGLALDYKLLRPQLATDTNFKERAVIGSVATAVYMGLKFGQWTINSKALYGQNMTDFTMLGGYAVHTIEPITHKHTYTNLGILSWWADLFCTKERYEPGLFMGITKNVGALATIHPELPDTIFALGPNIDRVMRISPRMRYFFTDAFTIGLEAEYTSAAYGTIERNGTVACTHTVGNMRLLLALYYNF